jgi:hypothetical protein
VVVLCRELWEFMDVLISTVEKILFCVDFGGELLSELLAS